VFSNADFDLTSTPIVYKQPFLQDIAPNQAREEWLANNGTRDNASRIQTWNFTARKRDRRSILRVFTCRSSHSINRLMSGLFKLASGGNFGIYYGERRTSVN